jgi:hypothetical protein
MQTSVSTPVIIPSIVTTPYLIIKMEFPDTDMDLSKADSLSLGLMMDIKTEKDLLESAEHQRNEKCLLDSDDVDACGHQSDLCKELSPSSSECPFANLPLFGDECGLELSQDCSMSSKNWSDSDDVPITFEKKKKKKKASGGSKKSGGVAAELPELPHKCPICGKRFLYSSNLTSHVKRHGEKSYECVQCHKTFALSVNYEAHMRFHNGIKPYSCEVSPTYTIGFSL